MGSATRCGLGALALWAATALAADARAGDWALGPEGREAAALDRFTFELGTVGLVGAHDGTEEDQLGGVVGARVRRWGPLTLELRGFSVAGGGRPDPVTGVAPPYVVGGIVPGLGVEVRRGGERVGVGLFLRPPLMWVRTASRHTRFRGPRWGGSLVPIPNLSLVVGDDRGWLELGGGGDPTPLDPRRGYGEVQWRSARGDAGAALGLALLGLVASDGAVVAPRWALGIHAAVALPLADEVGIELRADVAGMVALGVTFAYTPRLR